MKEREGNNNPGIHVHAPIRLRATDCPHACPHPAPRHGPRVGSPRLRVATLRERKDPWALYFPLLSSFVSAFLLLLLSYACFGEGVVRAWSGQEGAAFSLIVWLCTSCHGIFLDFTTMRLPFAVTLLFWMGSVASAAANGWVMGYWL